MNRDDRFRPRRDLLRDLRRIEIEEALLKIAENHLRAGQADRFRRGDRRVNRGDDFVARADAEAFQRGKQAARRAGHAANLGHALPFGHFLLEGFDLFAADVMTAVDDSAGRLVQGRFDGFMLSAQIEKRYFHKNLSTETLPGPTHPEEALSLPTAKNRPNLSCSRPKFNDIFRLSGFGRIDANAHDKPI